MNPRSLVAGILSGVFLVACQSQTPAEPPAAAPSGTETPAPARTAPASPGTTAGAAVSVLSPSGAPSELAGKAIPATVDWFGAIDLRALRGTVLERQFRPWLRYLSEQSVYAHTVKETGAGDLIGHALVVGGTFAPQSPMGFDLVAAVFGLEDEAKASAWVSARLAENEPVQGVTFETGHAAGVAWVSGPTLAGKVKALVGGDGESVNADPVWVELQRAIDTKASLWGLARVPEAVRSQLPALQRESPGLQFFPGVTELFGVTHAAISVNLGDRFELRIALRLQSADDAQVVAEQLQMAAEATLWEPTFFFDVFQVTSAGPVVALTAATSKKAWRAVVFWSSIAAQAVAYEQLRPRPWQ